MNLEIVRKSLISNLKTTYNRYKDCMVKYCNSTWIGDEGQMCTLGDMDTLLAELKESERVYIEARKDLDSFDVNPVVWAKERYGVELEKAV